MKIMFQVSPRLSCEIDGDSHKDVFEKLASVNEVFAETACGMCKSENISFQVRTVEDNNFYEMKCNDCGAKLGYGQHKKGNSLFAKRKLENGDYDKKCAGWHKYDAKKGK